MKNRTFKIDLPGNCSDFERDASENIQNDNYYSATPVKPSMPEQTIIPPPHVWDKIEEVLDSQETRRKTANDLIASSFDLKLSDFKPKTYLATVAGLSIAAGLMWIIR